MNIKNYKLGLSRVGILAVILIMLPNLAYIFYTPLNDVLSGNAADFWLWNVLEGIGRYGLMFSLCAFVYKPALLKNKFVNLLAACSLLAYYILWTAYFTGVFNSLTLIGLAFFPSAFFLLVSWRQKNIFALVLSALFSVMHICITGSNFLF